jgi:hypothetical protein
MFDLQPLRHISTLPDSDVAIDSEWVVAAATLRKPTFIFGALRTRNRVPRIGVIVRKRRASRAS